MVEPVVQFESVNLVFRSQGMQKSEETVAVRSLDLDVQPGETLGLVGESGSGKTSVGNLGLGLITPTKGIVRFNGQPIPKNRKKIRGQLSVVLQQPEWALNPRLHIKTTITEPLRVTAKSSMKSFDDETAEMLEKVGLESNLAQRYPHELSGGQRQRVAIARALITNPRFVVFDEAVSALDVSVQCQVLNLIKDLKKEQGFSSLFISHDIAATRYVSDRIAVMFHGELLEVAPAKDFYSRPRHPYSLALQSPIEQRNQPHVSLIETKSGEKSVGCVLSDRCPWSQPRCKSEKPKLRNLGDGLCACHRAEEISSLQ